MNPAPDDVNLWMYHALNTWAEQGDLPSSKSAQLHDLIVDLAAQERKRCLTHTACGFAAAIMVFIWLLFVSCPVAAAAYLGSDISQPPFALAQALVLMLILTCFLLKNRGSIRITKCFEVHYE
jgi:hypothetical protein